mmetsp:Transcript_30334/g.67245  ORF Transcript_30334/g.67245 Transcript_30334/m.67245 type:complete len:212 (+) Transcript_30334:3182-3817(+)
MMGFRERRATRAGTPMRDTPWWPSSACPGGPSAGSSSASPSAADVKPEASESRSDSSLDALLLLVLPPAEPEPAAGPAAAAALLLRLRGFAGRAGGGAPGGRTAAMASSTACCSTSCMLCSLGLTFFLPLRLAGGSSAAAASPSSTAPSWPSTSARLARRFLRGPLPPYSTCRLCAELPGSRLLVRLSIRRRSTRMPRALRYWGAYLWTCS